VDQDQSDNVTTTYFAVKGGRTAQFSAANSAQLPQAQTLTNGSDNALLNNFVDPALGCTPFTAPDLDEQPRPHAVTRPQRTAGRRTPDRAGGVGPAE
jgi:hypothetical protein